MDYLFHKKSRRLMTRLISYGKVVIFVVILRWGILLNLVGLLVGVKF